MLLHHRLLLLPWLALSHLSAADPLPAGIMPQMGDYTHMWWADGFPGRLPSAPWQRCIQTGRYAMVLDTATMRIPHFGAMSAGLDYVACARAGNRAWQALPAADLALDIIADGRTWHCTAGGKWTNLAGPRLIASGRFLQQADVTDLVFSADDGTRLNAEAHFETIAWPDRLGLVLTARPGLQPIAAGEASFGRIDGGFGLDGTNHLEIPHRPELDTERFTLELWAYVPLDYQASPRTFPWLVCKNHHEHADGNHGIVILSGGRPQARLNIGGGAGGMTAIDAHHPLKLAAWNHLAMSYDGEVLRFFVNGEPSGEKRIGRARTPGKAGLAIGRRQDNSGDGYHFRGVVDEIRLHDRALTPAEIRGSHARPGAVMPGKAPVGSWSFRADGQAAMTQPGGRWTTAAMEIRLTTATGTLRQRWDLPAGGTWTAADRREVALTLDPATTTAATTDAVTVQASEIPGGKARAVRFDAAFGAHRIDIDGVTPSIPTDGADRKNDTIERVKIILANPTDREQVARLAFEKNNGGFSVTGISAILRDLDGHPTGIPVQLSKNWHGRHDGGTHHGQWFRGCTQVRLPAKTTIPLELTIAYGHWGGVAAASHAQLCLIGWGSNQLWDQSALGSWGESICYEPDRAQAQCLVTDVRPVMVRAMGNGGQWGWTHNVGGGDFFRLFGSDGKRVFPGRMRTAYEKQGPCLTAVTYAGHCGEGIEHAATVSLGRTGDIVRGTYRLRLDVTRAMDFSRFVILQIGADTYSYTGERKMALGNETGLIKEWATQWGGNTYRTQPMECTGRIPWISLHEAVSRADRKKQKDGAWANRGLVIRSWQARLGGKPAAPWMAERGITVGEDSSTVDLIPPTGITRLEPGDFVETTIEHLVMPMSAGNYYGPDEGLRAALGKWGDTWRMIEREAVGNDRRVTVTTGTLEGLHPAVTIRAMDGKAAWTIAGGLGHVPITVTGLPAPRDQTLALDGRPVDQTVHGHDFWQTDYDAVSRTWSRTWNVPLDAGRPHALRLESAP